MNPVGEPDAGNPHVRFHERGRETERLLPPPRSVSTLPSTKLRLKQLRANALYQGTTSVVPQRGTDTCGF
jgi:hypothetical protein